MTNNAKVFLDEKYFISFNSDGTNNNIITVGYFDFAEPSNNGSDNSVFCSFRGEQIKQVIESQLDASDSEDCFAYITLPNGKTEIKLGVAKSKVDTAQKAFNYIQGMLVEYKLCQLSVAGSCKEPLYEVSTYLANGTLVSPTIACSLSDVARKIQALETNFDVNEAGFYNHVVRAALAQK